MAIDSHDERNKLVSTLKSALDQLNGELDRLEVQANLAKADAAEVSGKLREKSEVAFDKVKQVVEQVSQDLSAAAEGDWEQTKKDTDNLLQAVQDGIASLREKLR